MKGNLERRIERLEAAAARREAQASASAVPAVGELAAMMVQAFRELDAGTIPADSYHGRSLGALRQALAEMVANREEP